MFGDGRLLPDPGPLKTRPLHGGPQRSFSVANSGRAPIADELVARAFRELAPNDVQVFPVDVEGAAKPLYIINATKCFKCVDEANSREVQLYPPNGAAPERAGEYRSISGLRIDTSKIENARVFRIQGYRSAFIVSEEIKNALEGIGNLGVHFERVTGHRGGHADQRA
ncbi:imm11 family protein [Myxococcus sp. RHSTA-1-4]|uniref:imm11 family protein n=1 Tax=Myxococcus sp. RHSTA-1-4 TaxID=2874601 RepID=UPI001CBB5D4A|nr:DUF1629 domain-containing protein [Myxococcus sp. RHSTA-1-4]